MISSLWKDCSSISWVLVVLTGERCQINRRLASQCLREDRMKYRQMVEGSFLIYIYLSIYLLLHIYISEL